MINFKMRFVEKFVFHNEKRYHDFLPKYVQ